MSSLGLLISALLGWVWERLLEGHLGELKDWAKIAIIAGLCLITGGAQVYFQGGYDFAAMNVGDWLGYAATIFLASQVVYEQRSAKIHEIILVEDEDIDLT